MAASGWLAIDGRTWCFEDKGMRFYLLEGAERVLLHDSGMDVRNARELAEARTTRPVALFCTHADIDHVAPLGEFA